MTFKQWKNISDKLIKNGLEVAVISGGEPLLNSEITFDLMVLLIPTKTTISTTL